LRFGQRLDLDIRVPPCVASQPCQPDDDAPRNVGMPEGADSPAPSSASILVEDERYSARLDFSMGEILISGRGEARKDLERKEGDMI